MPFPSISQLKTPNSQNVAHFIGTNTKSLASGIKINVLEAERALMSTDELKDLSLKEQQKTS